MEKIQLYCLVQRSNQLYRSKYSYEHKSIALTLSDSASSVDFNGKEVTTGTEGTGIFLTGTGDIQV